MRAPILSLLVVSGLAASQAIALGKDDQKVEASAPTITRSAPGGQDWSVLSPRTVGKGQMAVNAELGFPGVSVGLLRGLGERLDAGFRFSLNLGVEGQPNLLVPGLKLQAQLRALILTGGRAELGVGFAPGALFYFFSSPALGVVLPVSVVLGLPLLEQLSVHGAFEVPLWITFTPNRAITLPLLFGGGFEYFINRELAATFKVRMGPSIDFGTSVARFAFDAYVGLALKL
jgi:hypothetical protein